MAWQLWRGVERSHVSLSSLRCYSSLSSSGCFAGIQGLREAKNWADLASAAHEKCQGLVDDITTSAPSSNTVAQLDSISDTLCQVLDAAEFCRNVHTDAEWRDAAQRVCIDLGAFVHTLNTNYGLYTALTKALTHRHSTPLDPETLLVGRMLQRDFERYGVHLDGTHRDRMATLVAETQTLGFHFTHNVIDPQKCGTLDVQDSMLLKALQTLPAAVQRRFRPVQQAAAAVENGNGRLYGLSAPGLSSTLNSIMTYSEHEALRRAAYNIYARYPHENLAVLDQLVTARHEIATLMGYPSYASYQLDEFSLAGKPGAVLEFLDALSAAIKAPARREAEILVRIKKQHSTAGNDVRNDALYLCPWDKDWSMSVAGQDMARSALAHLGDYLTLEGCLAGMNVILQDLFGVELRGEDPGAGEVWAPGVKKLLVNDVSSGSSKGAFLGVIYLDVYQRPGKFPGAAHFTLRCGRRLDGNDSDESSRYQTPVVALVMNFAQQKSTQCLTHAELETLLHELGHALNSLLSKTRYQHLSGTRGPQDVIEIPSHVFERFSLQPRALSIFAQHSMPGSSNTAPHQIPRRLLEAAAASKREFAAMSLQSTISLCAIDQCLHGESPPTGPAAEAAVVEIMQKYNSVLRQEEGSHPQVRFNHLIGYGGSYYCYPFAQCIASAVWKDTGTGTDTRTGTGSMDGSCPLAPPAAWPSGDVLRRRLLEPGGAKPAEMLVKDLFDCDASGSDVLINAKGGGMYPRIDGLMHHLGLN